MQTWAFSPAVALHGRGFRPCASGLWRVVVVTPSCGLAWGPPSVCEWAVAGGGGHSQLWPRMGGLLPCARGLVVYDTSHGRMRAVASCRKCGDTKQSRRDFGGGYPRPPGGGLLI